MVVHWITVKSCIKVKRGHLISHCRCLDRLISITRVRSWITNCTLNWTPRPPLASTQGTILSLGIEGPHQGQAPTRVRDCSNTTVWSNRRAREVYRHTIVQWSNLLTNDRLSSWEINSLRSLAKKERTPKSEIRILCLKWGECRTRLLLGAAILLLMLRALRILLIRVLMASLDEAVLCSGIACSFSRQLTHIRTV